MHVLGRTYEPVGPALNLLEKPSISDVIYITGLILAGAYICQEITAATVITVPVATKQDRGATGLLKALKIRTTPRLTPACSSSAAFTGSTSPNPPTCSCAPLETSERPASATDTEASWTVLSASAPSPATTTTKLAPVSEDDDW